MQSCYSFATYSLSCFGCNPSELPQRYVTSVLPDPSGAYDHTHARQATKLAACCGTPLQLRYLWKYKAVAKAMQLILIIHVLRKVCPAHFALHHNPQRAIVLELPVAVSNTSQKIAFLGNAHLLKRAVHSIARSLPSVDR